jgi:hypothetical protein
MVVEVSSTPCATADAMLRTITNRTTPVTTTIGTMMNAARRGW